MELDCNLNEILQDAVAAIGALTRNHHEYISHPFLISAMCKSEDANVHVDLLSLAWKACKQKKGMTKGKVYCLASNGESRCGKALVALTECTPLSLISLLFPHLGQLPLLNI